MCMYVCVCVCDSIRKGILGLSWNLQHKYVNHSINKGFFD